MNTQDVLQYAGAVCGLAGVALVCQRSAPLRRYGFLVWMYGLYLVTSGIGWWNNRTEPEAAHPSQD